MKINKRVKKMATKYVNTVKLPKEFGKEDRKNFLFYLIMTFGFRSGEFSPNDLPTEDLLDYKVFDPIYSQYIKEKAFNRILNGNKAELDLSNITVLDRVKGVFGLLAGRVLLKIF